MMEYPHAGQQAAPFAKSPSISHAQLSASSTAPQRAVNKDWFSATINDISQRLYQICENIPGLSSKNTNLENRQVDHHGDFRKPIHGDDMRLDKIATPSSLKSDDRLIERVESDREAPSSHLHSNNTKVKNSDLRETTQPASPVNEPELQANKASRGKLDKPDFNFLRGVMGPYIETIASNNDQTMSGFEHIPKNQAFVLGISHSLNTRDVATVIKRVSDHLYERGDGDKLPRMLIDRNLMTPPLRPFFGKKLGCVVADPENFARLHAEGESIGVCPEGQRGALTRKDTVSLRGRGLTVMALKYNMPIVPTVTAGAEALHKDVTDLLGPLKPYVQRPLDFLKDFIFERASLPITPGTITPSGPFPLYVLPPGQAFADKIHTEIGKPICAKTIVHQYNQAHGLNLTPEATGHTYEKNIKRLLSKCYRQLSPNGEYHNDDTERFRDVLQQVAQASEQPLRDKLLRQLPTPLFEAQPVRSKYKAGDAMAIQGNTDTAEPKNLAEQLANALCDQKHPEIFHSFQIVEEINHQLTEDMNNLLHTGQEIVAAQRKQPQDAQRRLKNNLLTLAGSAHLWWLSYKLHSALMPPLYAKGLQALYGARVLYELGRDAMIVWKNRSTEHEAEPNLAKSDASQANPQKQYVQVHSDFASGS